MKKKSKKYMSDERFNLLVESLNQALEYERGERDDLRVTVLPAPSQASAESATEGPSIMSDETSLRTLYAETAEEDRDLAEAGMADWAAALDREDAIVNLLGSGEVQSPALSQDEKENYLKELLAGMTEENLHPEIDFGPPVGKEVW